MGKFTFHKRRTLRSLSFPKICSILATSVATEESTGISVILGYGLRQRARSRKENRGLGRGRETHGREWRSCGRQMVTSRFVDNGFSVFPVYSNRTTDSVRLASAS